MKPKQGYLKAEELYSENWVPASREVSLRARTEMFTFQSALSVEF